MLLGKYTGFPRLGTGLQFLESPALRASLGMLDNEDMTGVMISDVDATAPAAAVLQPGDVVLSVDGIKVSYAACCAAQHYLSLAAQR
jgi:S1-C subfamily serine protease